MRKTNIRRGFLVAATLLAVALVVPLNAWARYPLDQILPADAVSKLAKAEVKTSSDMLAKAARRAGRSKLAKATGIDLKQLTAWVQLCDLIRVKGVGPTMAKLLIAAKVQTVGKLKKQRAKRLHQRLMKVNEKDKITENPPSEAYVADWIAGAKKLKAAVR